MAIYGPFPFPYMQYISLITFSTLFRIFQNIPMLWDYKVVGCPPKTFSLLPCMSF